MAKNKKKPVKANVKSSAKSKASPKKPAAVKAAKADPKKKMKTAAAAQKPKAKAKAGKAESGVKSFVNKVVSKAKSVLLEKETKQAKATKVTEKLKEKIKPGKKTKAGKKTKDEFDDDLAGDEIEMSDDSEALTALDASTALDRKITDEEELDEEIVLTDAEGNRICRVPDCDQVAQVDTYCRYHYLLFWKKIQVRKKILTEGKLERYIEELTSRYPDKFLEVLKKDLRSQKEFTAAIQELELDESGSDSEFEDETQNYIEEIRGVSETTSSRDEEDF